MDNNKYYPMNAAELLDMVLDIYKKSFIKQIAVTMIFNMIFPMIMYLVILVGGVGLVVSFGASMAAYNDPGDMILANLPMIIMFIAFIAVLVVIYQALTVTGSSIITKQTFLNEPVDIGSVLKQTLKKIIVASTAGLANTILMLPLLAIMGVFIYFYINMIMQMVEYNSAPATLTIITTIGIFVLMSVVSIIYYAITMFSIAVAVFENKYFFKAAKKSFQLIKPDFWKMIGLVTIWSLITFAVSYSFSGIFNLGAIFGEWILPQEAAAAVSVLSMTLGYIVSMTISILMMPLSGIFSTLLYINQRFKHEGLDIDLNLNNINNQRIRKYYADMAKRMPTPYPYGYYPGPRQ